MSSVTSSKDPMLMAARVFIGNLPTDKISQADLEDRFSQYGNVLDVRMSGDNKRSGGSGGHGGGEPPRKRPFGGGGGGGPEFRPRGPGPMMDNSPRGPPGPGPRFPGGHGPPGPGSGRFPPMMGGGPPPPLVGPGPPIGLMQGGGGGGPPMQNGHGPPPPGPGGPGGFHQHQQQGPPGPEDRAFYSRSDASSGSQPTVDSLPDVEAKFRPVSEVVLNRPYDCVFIVTQNSLRPYAENVEKRLLSLAPHMRIDMIFLTHDSALQRAIQDMVAKGVLYLIIIQGQHEMHGSITVNIAQGNAQEHRNMPVEQATGMLAVQYNRFALDYPRVSAPVIPAGVRTNSAVALSLAQGRVVAAAEADRLSVALKELKDCLAKALGEAPPSTNTSDIQKRILNMAGIAPGVGASHMPEMGGENPPSFAGVQGLDPALQKALQTLASNPAILQSLAGGGGQPMTSAAATTAPPPTSTSAQSSMAHAHAQQRPGGVGATPLLGTMMEQAMGGGGGAGAPVGVPPPPPSYGPMSAAFGGPPPPPGPPGGGPGGGPGGMRGPAPPRFGRPY